MKMETVNHLIVYGLLSIEEERAVCSLLVELDEFQFFFFFWMRRWENSLKFLES